MALRDQERTAVVKQIMHIMRQLVLAQKLDSDQNRWVDRYKIRKLTYEELGSTITRVIAPGTDLVPFPKQTDLPHYQKT